MFFGSLHNYYVHESYISKYLRNHLFILYIYIYRDNNNNMFCTTILSFFFSFLWSIILIELLEP